MTYTDYFLRFSDEAEAQLAFEAAGLYVPAQDQLDAYYVTSGHGFALDILGTLYEGGIYDPETGDVIEPPTPLQGWHANYRSQEPIHSALEPYVLNPEPTEPQRIFA